MQPFETAYVRLLERVLRDGEYRSTRNADTIALFGESLSFDMQQGFPILQGRKMYYRGVLGELAAMLRRPTNVRDFELWGCNYWKGWAKEDGSLTLDYGNAWFDFNGVNQIEALKTALRDNPTDRRMIISAWRPDRLSSLSLPCCHYSYQFYVRENTYLDMIWTQRSVDVAIGLPSDAIFAAAWLIAICCEFGYKPGVVKMDFGDTHVYADHESNAYKYIAQAKAHDGCSVEWIYDVPEGTDFCSFMPSDLTLLNYNPADPITFSLHR